MRFFQNFPFLTHWRMAGNSVPVLLVTANVGSIFEEVSVQDFFYFSFLFFLFTISLALNDRLIVSHDLPSNVIRLISFIFFHHLFFSLFFLSVWSQQLCARLLYYTIPIICCWFLFVLYNHSSFIIFLFCFSHYADRKMSWSRIY